MDGTKPENDEIFDDFDPRLMSEKQRKALLKIFKNAKPSVENVSKIPIGQFIVYGTDPNIKSDHRFKNLFIHQTNHKNHGKGN